MWGSRLCRCRTTNCVLVGQYGVSIFIWGFVGFLVGLCQNIYSMTDIHLYEPKFFCFFGPIGFRERHAREEKRREEKERRREAKRRAQKREETRRSREERRDAHCVPAPAASSPPAAAAAPAAGPGQGRPCAGPRGGGRMFSAFWCCSFPPVF